MFQGNPNKCFKETHIWILISFFFDINNLDSGELNFGPDKFTNLLVSEMVVRDE